MPDATLSAYIELLTECVPDDRQKRAEAVVRRLIDSIVADAIERARDNETLGDIPRDHIDRVLLAAFPPAED